MTDQNSDRDQIMGLTAEIVAAHVANNAVSATDLPGVISAVHDQLSRLGQPAEPVIELVPAVPIKKSVQHDHIVCLEDGRKLKMLKRHLATAYNMTPEEYRAKWGLPYDYPMVAPSYSQTRKDLAVKIGLGRKPAKPAAKAKAPVKRTRKKAAA